MGQHQGQETVRRPGPRVRPLHRLRARTIEHRLPPTLRSISYYEWQKKGTERVPHFTRHKNGKLMLLAGLYDTAAVEGRCPSAALLR